MRRIKNKIHMVGEPEYRIPNIFRFVIKIGISSSFHKKSPIRFNIKEMRKYKVTQQESTEDINESIHVRCSNVHVFSAGLD